MGHLRNFIRSKYLSVQVFTSFLGRRILWLLIGAIFCGLLLFCTELLFSHAVQSLFQSFGLLSEQQIKVPVWIPRRTELSILTFFAVTAIARSTLQWGGYYLQGAATELLKHRIRSCLVKETFRGTPAESGLASSILGERATSSGTALSYLTTALVFSTSSFCLGFALFKISPLLTGLSSAFLLIAAGPIKLMNSRLGFAGAAIAAEWEVTNSRLLRGIKNLLLLRIYGMTAHEEAATSSSLDRYLTHSLKYFKLSGFIQILPQIAGAVLICLIAFSVRREASLPPGALLAYLYLMFRFLQGLSSAAHNFSTFIFYKSHLMNALEWWKYLTDSPDSSEKLGSLSSNSISTREGTGPIGWRLQNVSFRYEHADSLVIENLSFDLKAGTSLLITGPSGAGKSTLLALMIGSLKPTNGMVSVCLGGAKATEVRANDSFLNRIGYVGSECFLIEGSVKENLLYGVHAQPTELEIHCALNAAGCDFLFKLKHGLDHLLTEQGLGLSAGQKQRLSLARALLRKPDALFLDEATSNLDDETERRLILSLAKLKGKMTIIAITHRPALREISDLEIVLSPIAL